MRGNSDLHSYGSWCVYYKVYLSRAGIFTADITHSTPQTCHIWVFRYFCSCFIFLIEVNVWTFPCHSAILLYLLPTFHLFYFTLHLLTFLLFSCLLSRLWGAKQLLAFLLSFVCKVFGFGLPLLFSWEMAEAVFREGFGRFDGEGKYLRLFLNEIFFCVLSLSNIWINQASLTCTSYKQYK